MSAFFRIAVSSLGAAAAVVLAGCASSGKPVAATAEKPVTVTVEAPMAEKDALGNYRFLMQQAGKNMSADQFDAWMKANGIRVARGDRRQLYFVRGADPFGAHAGFRAGFLT